MKKMLLGTFACIMLAGTVNAKNGEKEITDFKLKVKAENLKESKSAIFGHCGGTASFADARGNLTVYNMDPVSSDNAVDCNKLFGAWMQGIADKTGGTVFYYTNLFSTK